MWAIRYEPRVRREIRSLRRDAAVRLLAEIDHLGEEPRPAGSRKLSGLRRDLYRISVGRYRVVYEIRDDQLIVLIVRVAKRDEATYRNL